MFRSRSPPPTEKTRTLSSAPIRLPASQPSNASAHPASLMRAVNSETLSCVKLTHRSGGPYAGLGLLRTGVSPSLARVERAPPVPERPADTRRRLRADARDDPGQEPERPRNVHGRKYRKKPRPQEPF